MNLGFRIGTVGFSEIRDLEKQIRDRKFHVVNSFFIVYFCADPEMRLKISESEEFFSEHYLYERKLTY